MAIVQPKSQRLRLVLAPLFLLLLCAAVVFPFLVVISVSLRPGNFASGSLIPPAISLEHWRFVLGLPYPGPDGQPILPDLPVMRWLWNSIKVALLSGTVTLLLSTTASYAPARLRFRGRQHQPHHTFFTGNGLGSGRHPLPDRYCRQGQRRHSHRVEYQTAAGRYRRFRKPFCHYCGCADRRQALCRHQ